MVVTPQTGWPAECPPDDTSEPDGRFFHLVSFDPPDDQADCVTVFERDPKKASGCGYFALSIYVEIEDIRTQYRFLKRRHPKVAAKKWKFIAEGKLETKHGLIKLVDGATDTHTNWWPADDLAISDRCDLFQVVEATEPGP